MIRNFVCRDKRLIMQKEIRFSSKFWLVYFSAWIPYALSYIAVFLTQDEIEISNLLFSVCRNVLSAALLGIFIVWICNRLNWSLHRRIWFFPLHLTLAILFSLVWAGILFLLFSIDSFNRTGNWEFVSFVGNALQWQAFTGFTFYATIASVMYVLQVVRNLREEERRAARAETLYAQTSLAALQAQLNPHFLFNTLHTLMALVRYDPDKAEKALEKLAEMLRYSLKDKRDSKNYLVRLADELQFVDNYLELEKLRLGDRLTVHKNIESHTLDCLIPAFTIQPLVENSIKHGIAPRSISAAIFISAKKQSDFLKIEIKDSGIGLQNDKLGESNGLGLNLVREQLIIQYGEKSVFEIDSKQNRGFKVRIEIPVQYAEKRIEEKKSEVEYSHINS